MQTFSKKGFGTRTMGYRRTMPNPQLSRELVTVPATSAASFMRAAGYASVPRLPFAMGQRSGISGYEVKSFDQQITIPAANLPVFAGVAGVEPAVAFTGMTEINCIQQGATVAQRIGNKVVVRSIHIRAVFSGTAGAPVGSMRWMIVYDKQPNGAFPLIGDILTDQPAGAGTALSSINIANKSRFLMIRDQFETIDIGSSTIKVVNQHCKGRWEVEYGATVGNIGDFRTGSILFLAWLVTVPVPSIQMGMCQTRVRYMD